MRRSGMCRAVLAGLRPLSAAIVVAVTMSACQTESKGKLEPVGQARVDVLHAACIKGGGEYVQVDNGNYLCLEQTSDNGKSCSVASDCESACLARSQSCAPVSPLLGCNEILTGSGLRVMQCIE